MAAALLPIFILSLIQTQADFRQQAQDRQVGLQLAAERSADNAKAQLDSAHILLRALAPDAMGPYCASRLTALVNQLEGYEGLYRLNAGARPSAPPAAATAQGRTWPPRPKPLGSGD